MQAVGPLVDYLKRRWLKPGNCLRHAGVLLQMPDELRVECVLCQGAFTLVMGQAVESLHCWLESGGDVADLTRIGGARFFSVESYYERMRIDPASVRRYTVNDIAKKMLNGECYTFWGFDLSRYAVRIET